MRKMENQHERRPAARRESSIDDLSVAQLLTSLHGKSFAFGARARARQSIVLIQHRPLGSMLRGPGGCYILLLPPLRTYARGQCASAAGGGKLGCATRAELPQGRKALYERARFPLAEAERHLYSHRYTLKETGGSEGYPRDRTAGPGGGRQMDGGHRELEAFVVFPACVSSSGNSYIYGSGVVLPGTGVRFELFFLFLQ